MSQSSKTNHRNIPALECPQFLAELLERPCDYEVTMENYTGRIISRLAFGDSRHYEDIRHGSHGLLKAISPAAYITNIIPQLRLLPDLMSPWKWIEARRHAEEHKFFMRMYNEVATDMEAGSARSSYMRHVLENKTKMGVRDEECAYIVGMIGLAGVLTTSSAMMTYLLAMVLYPEWQIKLQAEVDLVCGDRLPELSDAPKMPILRAVIKELMRWRPITPSSIPHQSTEDDVYEGYFIPKGTFIHPNQWAITRDAEMYPDPETFNPDRWLKPCYPSYREPLTEYPSIQSFTTFGYGRRICMGMDLVEHEFFIAIGAMAWATTISTQKNNDGSDTEVLLHDYSTYLISRPRKFPFDLRPRSQEKQRLLQHYRKMANQQLEIS